MGFIYSPHLKRAIGGIFYRASLVELSESCCKSLETGLRPDKSDTIIEQVPWGFSRCRYWSLETGHGPDKSGGGTRQVWYPPLKAGENSLKAG
jgi:hypothetical protein